MATKKVLRYDWSQLGGQERQIRGVFEALGLVQGFTVEDPAPKPEGVWVKEGMQITHEAGYISVVRKKSTRDQDAKYISLWHSNGDEAAGIKSEYTYKGKPVLGYEEDAK